MTCKDCVHFGACGKERQFLHVVVNDRCKDFKDKSRIIEMPCCVGDTIYYIHGLYYDSSHKDVMPIIVTEISQKIVRGKLQTAVIANRTRYTLSGLGKTWFLTFEDAENELNKRG